MTTENASTEMEDTSSRERRARSWDDQNLAVEDLGPMGAAKNQEDLRRSGNTPRLEGCADGTDEPGRGGNML